jgi:hypothetical protein
MLEASMIKRKRAWFYRLVFSKPYLSGTLLPLYPVCLAMQIFVLFFPVPNLLGVVSGILLVCLGCTPCASNKFKKKNREPIRTSVDIQGITNKSLGRLKP